MGPRCLLLSLPGLWLRRRVFFAVVNRRVFFAVLAVARSSVAVVPGARFCLLSSPGRVLCCCVVPEVRFVVAVVPPRALVFVAVVTGSPFFCRCGGAFFSLPVFVFVVPGARFLPSFPGRI